jgi:hypothetical protein
MEVETLVVRDHTPTAKLAELKLALWDWKALLDDNSRRQPAIAP